MHTQVRWMPYIVNNSTCILSYYHTYIYIHLHKVSYLEYTCIYGQKLNIAPYTIHILSYTLPYIHTIIHTHIDGSIGINSLLYYGKTLFVILINVRKFIF